MSSRTRWNELSMHHITLEQAAGYYEVFNKTSGKSEHTVHWYNERLRAFTRWLRRQAYNLTERLGSKVSQNTILRVSLHHLRDACTKNPKRNPLVEAVSRLKK